MWIIIYLLLNITVKVTAIWSIVSFILYLIKDEPYNFTVLYIFIAAYLLYKFMQSILKYAINNAIHKSKKSFKERLEEKINTLNN